METLVHYGQKVSDLYDCYKRGDIDSVLESLSHDCIWEVMGQPDVPFSGIYHGKDDIRGFFGKLNDCLDMTEFSVEHILENGNMVIASGHYNATAKQTSKHFGTMFAMTFEFDNNEMIVHFRDCFDTLACSRAVK